MPDPVVLVMESAQVLSARPAWTDYRDAGRAPVQCLVNPVAPLALAAAMNIAKYGLLAESYAEPVVQAVIRAAGVIAPITDEDMVASHGWEVSVDQTGMDILTCCCRGGTFPQK